MGQSQSFQVVVRHDEAVGVWYVLSSDIPGLNAEAGTLDELLAVVSDLAPELVEANLPDMDGERPDFAICVQHMLHVKRLHTA